MRDLHWTLDSLPPNMRIQAEQQLGIEPSVPYSNVVSQTQATKSKVFAVPNSTPPKGAEKPCRRRGGMYKANSYQGVLETAHAAPVPSPAGFMSIAEMRAAKKVSKKRKYLTPDMAKTLVKSCEVSPDGNEVRFVLACSPYMIPTAQLKKIAMIGGHPRIYKQPKVQKAEKTIMLAMQPFACKFSGWGESPRNVIVDLCYEYPKGTPKKFLADYRYSVSKNDVDNSYKGLGDALTAAGFWEDDRLVADLRLRKFRVLTDPRVEITIKRLPSVLESETLFPSHYDLSDKQKISN